MNKNHKAVLFSGLIVLLSFILGGAITANSNELKPFTSDGCSAFPEGTRKQKNLWLSCCTAHDYSYWQGGTQQDRAKADQELKQCVSKAGKQQIAIIMLAGVRVGGTPFLPTNFRWGYGWPYPRYYGELSDVELQQINKLKKLPSNINIPPTKSDSTF